MNCLESHAFVQHADVLTSTTTFFLKILSFSILPLPFLCFFFLKNRVSALASPSALLVLCLRCWLTCRTWPDSFNGGLVGTLVPLPNCSLTIWITPTSFYKFLLYLSDHSFIFPYSLLNYNLISQELN